MLIRTTVSLGIVVLPEYVFVKALFAFFVVVGKKKRFHDLQVPFTFAI